MARTTIEMKTVKEVKGLVSQADTLYFRLGRLLVKLRDSRLGQDLPFDEKFISEKLHLKYRRARYLVNIYESFTQARVSERSLKGLAWSKAKEIARLPDEQLRANFKQLAEYARENTRQNLVAKINREFQVSRRRA